MFVCYYLHQVGYVLIYVYSLSVSQQDCMKTKEQITAAWLYAAVWVREELIKLWCRSCSGGKSRIIVFSLPEELIILKEKFMHFDERADIYECELGLMNLNMAS